MGSSMSSTIFNDQLATGLKDWHRTAKKNVKHSNHTETNHPFQVLQQLPHVARPRFTYCTTITIAAMIACMHLQEGPMSEMIIGTIMRVTRVGIRSKKSRKLKSQAHCSCHQLHQIIHNMKSTLVRLLPLGNE